MALAGITSQIPPDQVIDAMKEVGDRMHASLKRNGRGRTGCDPSSQKYEYFLFFLCQVWYNGIQVSIRRMKQ